jgi:23S rRNA (cytidine1920-2'-O)/16S rRNA (cytidine1409-2'-O)-methyltransferase
MSRPEKTAKERLDALLVARGLSRDVDTARRAIWAGEVLVDGDLADQPGTRYATTVEIRLRTPARPYVTRGGEKLANALARFDIEVTGRIALDIGAAGGGFTDCLLTHGATRVYAVEVGRGQLAQRLRLDPRVVDLGGRDVMGLDPAEVQPPAGLATIDVTFRSLTEVLPRVLSLLAAPAEAVVLVKPLQEAATLGMDHVPDVPRAVLELLLTRFAEAGLPVRNLVPSDPPGLGGALEFFLHIGTPGAEPETLAATVAAALAEGAARLAQDRAPRRSGQQRRKNWSAFRRRHRG